LTWESLSHASSVTNHTRLHGTPATAARRWAATRSRSSAARAAYSLGSSVVAEGIHSSQKVDQYPTVPSWFSVGARYATGNIACQLLLLRWPNPLPLPAGLLRRRELGGAGLDRFLPRLGDFATPRAALDVLAGAVRLLA